MFPQLIRQANSTDQQLATWQPYCYVEIINKYEAKSTRFKFDIHSTPRLARRSLEYEVVHCKFLSEEGSMLLMKPSHALSLDASPFDEKAFKP